MISKYTLSCKDGRIGYCYHYLGNKDISNDREIIYFVHPIGINNDEKKYTLKIIHDNGGWDNWICTKNHSDHIYCDEGDIVYGETYMRTNQTHFYELSCKDTTIKDKYIFSSNKLFAEKTNDYNFIMCALSYPYDKDQLCNNPEKTNVIEFITKNGGWKNWQYIKLDIIRKFDYPPGPYTQLRNYIDIYKPSLNINIPPVKRRPRKKKK